MKNQAKIHNICICLLCADVRNSSCFTEYSATSLTCAEPTEREMIKAVCCCTIGKGYSAVNPNTEQLDHTGEFCKRCPLTGSGNL